MNHRDKTKCTVICQGKEADLENRAAVEDLLTPMFADIHQRRGNLMPTRQQYLMPELQPTAIHLAKMVRQLDALEEEKKKVAQEFKERIELLKIQIKQASTEITDSLEEVTRIAVVPEENRHPAP